LQLLHTFESRRLLFTFWRQILTPETVEEAACYIGGKA
jgi:hypothetical protein